MPPDFHEEQKKIAWDLQDLSEQVQNPALQGSFKIENNGNQAPYWVSEVSIAILF
jgi:hypothetical protein